MTISEKVAYVKGLAEGLGLDTEKSKEGKLISVMIGILEEVGMSIEDLEENALALGEEIDALSDDLSDIEGIFEDLGDHHHGCDCDYDDDFELTCPSCETAILITDDMLDAGEIHCPDCKGHFIIDLSDEKSPFHLQDDWEDDENSEK
ncbi:MAG: hypothetical protein R3Y63_12455 [Eubacteriales bacterium]